MQYLPALNPVVRVYDNPLRAVGGKLEFLYDYDPVVEQCMWEIVPPESSRAVLFVNGVPLLQREWFRPVLPGDVIEWHILSGGKGGSRAILMIVAAIAIAWFTAGLGLTPFQTAALSIGLNLAAGLLINALIPIKPASSDSSALSAGSVYNTSLASNQARLNSPIPVIYGRMRVYPDFAAQPYAKYRNNDQYYHALFCIGQGEYAIEALMVDDTPISNFKGVYYKVLAPGVQPSQVQANIVTSIEVAGNQLDFDTPIGGFIVCGARKQVNKLEWDFSADQGIGAADDSGVISSFTVQIQINIRYVDDFGVPTTDWAKLGVSSLRAASRTPQRFTFSIQLDTPGRPMIQMVRLTPKQDSSHVLDTITWTGLRGKLTVTAPLCATATYLELVMKANEQLNGITQKKLNVIARRKLRTFTETGLSVGISETRNIAAAVADVLVDPTYGAGRPESELDNDTLFTLDGVYLDRQDRLDIIFDSRITVRDALKTIAQVGRAVAIQRMGIWSMVRDQYQALPFAAYTTREILPGTTAITYALATPETADGISYEYFDNRSWDWVPIMCPAPGVITPVNPVTLRVTGITGAFQALREGTYLSAVNLYRRKFPKWQTHLKGLLGSYGAPVIYSPALPGWGSPGDIVAWDQATLRARLSEAPAWKAGANHFITLERPNGKLTIAIPVFPGNNANEVVLRIDPGFVPITLDSDSERTKYIFGPEGQHQVIVRLLNVSRKGTGADGSPLVELSGVAENNLVHTADNAYLPAGGIIQDPVPTTVIDTASADGGGSGITMQSHELGGIGFASIFNDGSIGGGFELQMFKDGTAAYRLFANGTDFDSNSPDISNPFYGEWLSDDLEPGSSAQFEVKVTYFSDLPDSTAVGSSLGSTFDEWENLGAFTERNWRFGVSQTTYTHNNDVQLYYVNAGFRVQIRKAGANVNLADVTITAIIQFTSVSSSEPNPN